MKSSAVWLVAFFAAGELGTRWLATDDCDGDYEFGLRPNEGFTEVGTNLVIEWTRQRRFRNQSIGRSKPEGRKRIFVFGDSVARGTAAQTPYAARLEGILQRDGIDAEVMNFAAIGAGCRKIGSILTAAMEYHPDVVVIHLNAHNEAFDERDWTLRQQFVNWHPRFWLAHSRMFRKAGEWKRTNLYERMLPRMAGPLMQENEKFVLFEKWNFEVYSNRVARVQTVTGQSIRMVRDAGVEVVLVSPVQVTERDGRFHFDDEGFDDYCNGLAKDRVSYVSMTKLFRTDTPFDSHLKGDGVHLDDQGHARLGAALAKHILESGLLE